MSVIAEGTSQDIGIRNVRTGSKPLHTANVKVASGQTILALTVLALSASTNKVVPHDPASADAGIKKALFIAPHDIDTTAGDKVEPLVDGGDFNPDALIWDAGLTDDDARVAAFADTDISMIKPYGV